VFALLCPHPSSTGSAFMGVLAPHCSLRARVVFTAQAQIMGSQPTQLWLFGELSQESSLSLARPTAGVYRTPWAELLRRTFAVDGLHCSDCGGRMKPCRNRQNP